MGIFDRLSRRRGAAPASAAAPRFGQHQVVRALGAGAMGDVYEVVDLQTGEHQALKVLRDPTPESLLRFKREFRAMRELAHPNLVGLHQLAVDGAAAYFTMDLVPGPDLLAHVRPERRGDAGADTVPPPVAHLECDAERMRACLRQLAGGLAAMHGAGKVHRDLKPSNVRVRPDGRVIVLDFGLVLDQLDPIRTSTGITIGTPAYMAPEQVHGRAVAASDWYAVGVMLYEALTGWLPFRGGMIEMLCERRRREPPPPSQVVPGIAPDLDQLCADLLRIDPAARPSADEVLERLSGGVRVRSAAPEPAAESAAEHAELRRIAAERGVRGGVLVGSCTGDKHPLLRALAVSAHERGVAALYARGQARERVRFQLFDGIVDTLSRLWQDDAPRAAHVPIEAAFLAGVFPVLRRLAALADVEPLPGASPRTVARALAGCLGALAAHGDVVVCIADVDRADPDSRLALAELLAAPDLPPVCFLFSAASLTELDLPGWIEVVSSAA